MKEDLTPYRLDLAIVRETAQRIINDFELLGIEIIFSGNKQNAYQELMNQLIPAMNTLLAKNKQKLMQVLYRIDISEEKLSKTVSKFPKVQLAEIISHLVIEREIQKVITRKIF